MKSVLSVFKIGQTSLSKTKEMLIGVYSYSLYIRPFHEIILQYANAPGIWCDVIYWLIKKVLK